jgi:hypothetical protein
MNVDHAPCSMATPLTDTIETIFLKSWLNTPTNLFAGVHAQHGVGAAIHMN